MAAAQVALAVNLPSPYPVMLRVAVGEQFMPHSLSDMAVEWH